MKMKVGLDLSINSIGLVMIIVDETKETTDYSFVLPQKETKSKKPQKEKIFIFKKPHIIDEKFVNIISTEPKSAKSYSQTTQIIHYDRVIDESTYSKSDMSKIISSKTLASRIKEIILKYATKHNIDDIDVRVEGISMGFGKQQGRLVDLTMFVSITKLMLLGVPQIKTIDVVPPKSLKLMACGIGNADKKPLEDVFKVINPQFHIKGKIDDVIDAWFLATIQIDNNTSFKK